MFPHYMEVAGWLAVAAVALAWVALAAYLTVSIARDHVAPRSERVRWVLTLWLAPVVGIAVYLFCVGRNRRRGPTDR